MFVAIEAFDDRVLIAAEDEDRPREQPQSAVESGDGGAPSARRRLGLRARRNRAGDRLPA